MMERRRQAISHERARAGLVCRPSALCRHIERRDKFMKMLVVGAALATLVASPAFAQGYDPDVGTIAWSAYQGGPAAFARVGPRAIRYRSPHNAYGAVTPFGSPGERHVSAARAAAIHQCSAVAARYTEYTWGVQEIQLYRACMAEHGQV
jgi:hypothetical protein